MTKQHVLAHMCILIGALVYGTHAFGQTDGTGVARNDVAGDCFKSQIFVGPAAHAASSLIGNAAPFKPVKDDPAHLGFWPSFWVPNARNARGFTRFGFDHEIAIAMHRPMPNIQRKPTPCIPTIGQSAKPCCAILILQKRDHGLLVPRLWSAQD